MIDTKDILRYYLKGKQDVNWYSDLNLFLKNAFPNDDIKVICDLLAATSIHSSLKSNIAQFFKAKNMLENNIKFKGFLPTIIAQLNFVKEGKDLTGRKIRNFSEAMQGNTSAVVVDIWVCRAFNIDITRIYKGRDVSRSPTTKEYNNIENYIQEQAFLCNMEPRSLCAAIWSGCRIENTGKLNTTRYQDVIRAELQQLKIY